MSRSLEICSALFAGVAAISWFLSTVRKLPPLETNWNRMPESSPFFKALKFSARMNAIAAGCSGLSAVALSVKLFLFPF